MEGVVIGIETRFERPSSLACYVVLSCACLELVAARWVVLLRVVDCVCTKNNNNPIELYLIDNDNYRTRRHATCTKHG